jgi:hypothetical protein
MEKFGSGIRDNHPGVRNSEFISSFPPVKCGAVKPAEFRCHKLMIHGFLVRQLGHHLLTSTTLTMEEEEWVLLLPHTEPAAFSRYLDLVYGVVYAESSSSEVGFGGLEAEPGLRDAVEEVLFGSLFPAIQESF